MITCLITFEVRPGKEARRDEFLEVLLPAAATIDGFVSRRTFQNTAKPAELMTVSLWRDENALAAWMAHPDHRAAIAEGKDIFLRYEIQISETRRAREWSARDG